MSELRAAFERDGDGTAMVLARSGVVDELALGLWAEEIAGEPALAEGVALAAVGGYGRRQLFPHSDIDLLFLTAKSDVPAVAKDAIRRVTQALWDCGMRVAPATRGVGDCERFSAGNPEFGLALLDYRALGGDADVLERMESKSLPRLMKDAKAMIGELGTLLRGRHAKNGNTLFHLEPNIKDCPGGLRDVHTAEWLRRLRLARVGLPERVGRVGLPERVGRVGRVVHEGEEAVVREEGFAEAQTFLASVRCFLHYRYERDDNTLDWRSQDAAAEQGIGVGRQGMMDASYWMRAYFRNARAVERRLLRECELAGVMLEAAFAVTTTKVMPAEGFRMKDSRITLLAEMRGGHGAARDPANGAGRDPAHDPDVVLAVFAVMAATGARLDPLSEERIVNAIPVWSAHLEEGPGLWRKLSAVLTGERAGTALRCMHTLGVLELILPEFHGIDALVIRDAYHRYTVDEHTFVLIDTLHELASPVGSDASDWRKAFGMMQRELQHAGLLFLAALLHDTGKGRAGEDHAVLSAEIAENVLERLEMDSYEASIVVGLIRNHLEMSAALRRDIFDAETVRAFAAKVQTQEQLRMLTLFTYADIHAVHPDALTPWKAENLWRLAMATANQLDRSVDEERVHALGGGGGIRVAGVRRRDARIVALARGQEAEVERFLEGFPERYLETRPAEAIYGHFALTATFDEEPYQIAFRHGNAVSEITLVTRDRPRLFAGMAAALAAWGMNVLTADAFANAEGVVVDSFRFTDTFRTLELNGSERERFVQSVRELVAGRTPVETMLNSRRRSRRESPRVVVETRVEFDDTASSHSTLLQVAAQDVSGLLRTVSATISRLGHSVEVALVDTEGETAFDVFYLTRQRKVLSEEQKQELRSALLEAIAENAR